MSKTPNKAPCVVPKLKASPKKSAAKTTASTKSAEKPKTVTPKPNHVNMTAEEETSIKKPANEERSFIGREPAIATTGKYELVRPQTGKQHDTWAISDRTTGNRPRPPKLRAWWRKHEYSMRVIILVLIVAGFSFLILISLSMIGVGVYSMSAQSMEMPTIHWVDERLKTKTTACRATMDSRSAQCVYELKTHYDDCASPYVCGLLNWEFEYDPTTGAGRIKDFRREPSQHHVDIQDINYAECGYLKWCLNEACVESNVSSNRWWSTGEKTFHQFDRWETIDQIPPCMFQKEDGVSTNHWNHIHHWYHGQCNTSACANAGVKYGMQIEYQRCVLDEDLELSGLRHIPCDSANGPVNFVRCHICPKYDKKKEADLRKCSGKLTDLDADDNCLYKCNGQYQLVPDGARCGNQKNGVCFMGHCQMQLKAEDGHSAEDDY